MHTHTHSFSGPLTLSLHTPTPLKGSQAAAITTLLLFLLLPPLVPPIPPPFPLPSDRRCCSTSLPPCSPLPRPKPQPLFLILLSVHTLPPYSPLRTLDQLLYLDPLRHLQTTAAAAAVDGSNQWQLHQPMAGTCPIPHHSLIPLLSWACCTVVLSPPSPHIDRGFCCIPMNTTLVCLGNAMHLTPPQAQHPVCHFLSLSLLSVFCALA